MNPFLLVPAELKDLKPVCEINTDMIFYSVHFLGTADTAAALFELYENSCTIKIREDSLWDMEFNTLDAAELTKLLSGYPYLKVTGFIENWQNAKVYTFLSASGYPFITDCIEVGRFSRASYGGADRFTLTIDVMTDSYHQRDLDMETGNVIPVDYSYPFRMKWNHYDLIVPAADGTLMRIRQPENFLVNDNKLLKCYLSEGNVSIPDGIESIADTAFHSFTDIKTLSVPDSVRPGAFMNKNPLMNFMQLQQPIYNRSQTMLFAYPEQWNKGHFNVPASVKHIAYMALANNSLSSVSLSEGLETVGSFAFSYSRNYMPWNRHGTDKGIQNVTLPASVHTIGAQSLRTLTVLGSLESCGNLQCDTLTIKGDLKKCDRVSVYTLSIGGTFPADLEIDGDMVEVIRTPKMPFDTYTAKTRKAALIGFAQLRKEGVEIDKAIADGYLTYLKRQRKKLYPLCAKHPELMYLMIEEKLIPEADIDLLLPILEKAKLVSETSVLLSYKKAIAPEEKDELDSLDSLFSEEKPKKKGSKTKAADPFSPAEIKKEWAFEKLEDGTIRLTACKSTQTNIYIPERVGKDIVTELGEFLLSPNKPRLSTALKEARMSTVSVSVPSGVKVIGKGVFADCPSLQTVTLSDTVCEIGDEAFGGCSDLTGISLCDNPVLFMDNGVLYQRLENGIKAVAARTDTVCTLRADTAQISPALFKNHTVLTTVKLGETLTEIPDNAFSGCSALCDIALPEGLSVIGASAFFGCKALQNITLPASLTAVGSFSFSQSGLTAVDIPSGVCEISESAFESCADLKTLVLHEGIVSIGRRAFRYCHVLESMNFPSTLTTVFNEAFRQCLGFKKLDIPATVTDIRDWGFARCDNAIFYVREGSAAHNYVNINFYQFKFVR